MPDLRAGCGCVGVSSDMLQGANRPRCGSFHPAAHSTMTVQLLHLRILESASVSEVKTQARRIFILDQGELGLVVRYRVSWNLFEGSSSQHAPRIYAAAHHGGCVQSVCSGFGGICTQDSVAPHSCELPYHSPLAVRTNAIDAITRAVYVM